MGPRRGGNLGSGRRSRRGSILRVVYRGVAVPVPFCSVLFCSLPFSGALRARVAGPYPPATRLSRFQKHTRDTSAVRWNETGQVPGHTQSIAHIAATGADGIAAAQAGHAANAVAKDWEWRHVGTIRESNKEMPSPPVRRRMWGGGGDRYRGGGSSEVAGQALAHMALCGMIARHGCTAR